VVDKIQESGDSTENTEVVATIVTLDKNQIN
jgi:hypothetical protein